MSESAANVHREVRGPVRGGYLSKPIGENKALVCVSCIPVNCRWKWYFEKATTKLNTFRPRSSSRCRSM